MTSIYPKVLTVGKGEVPPSSQQADPALASHGSAPTQRAPKNVSGACFNFYTGRSVFKFLPHKRFYLIK
jgi:hypothetical protein